MIAGTLGDILFVSAVVIYAIFIVLLLGWGCLTAWFYVYDRDDWNGQLERDKRFLMTSVLLFAFATFLTVLGVYTLSIRMGW